jgi:hypothetical protein
MNNLDQLFRDKLSTHQKTPAPAAWEKLESRLDKKRRSTYPWWIGIAATVSLLIIGGLLIYKGNFITSNEGQLANQNQISNVDNSIASNETPIINETIPVHHNEEHIPEIEAITIKENTVSTKLIAKSTGRTETKFTIEVPQIDTKILEFEPADQDPMLAQNSEKLHQQINSSLEETQKYQVVIIYKPSVDQKVIFGTDEEEEEVEKSKLKKFFNKADISLAKLRDAKEDLFAIDFSLNNKNKNSEK